MLNTLHARPKGEQATALHTFEHGGQLIYIHAHASLPRGWAIDVAVVGPNGSHHPRALHIAWNSEVSCPSLDAAMLRAEETARAFVDGRSSTCTSSPTASRLP